VRTVAEPFAEGNDARLGRRPPLLRGYPLAATVANISRGSLVEINVVDPFVRKGYRFKGPAVIHEPETDEFVEGIERLRQQGSKFVDRVKTVVVVEVQKAQPLVSPAYDDGTTSEAEMVKTFEARFARLHERFRDA
jgi:hypothetical protein